MTKWIKYALCTGAVVIGSSCAEWSYYGQALDGHWQLIEQRRPVRYILADPNTPATLREQLEMASQLRDFASTELALPDNNSYRSYADLGRPAVVYNVFAAPELSLRAKTWCFPMLGCVSYRGYFSFEQAQQLAGQLRKQGYDVFVGNVPAYSTLGWFDDPLLNTFMHWPVGRVAELMFHELAHQRVFIADDTEFNESFANAVGQLGAELWLQDKPEKLLVYRHYREYRDDFLELMGVTKSALLELYQSRQPATARRDAKQQLFDQLRATYYQLKTEKWNGYSGYDGWFEQDLNNAKFVALTAYTRYVPAFINLFHNAGDNFAAFYQAVEKLGKLSKQQRQKRLQGLLISAPEQSLTSSAITAKAVVAGS